MKRCAIPGCGRAILAKGLCHTHDMRRRMGWSMTEPIRPIRAALTNAQAAEIRARYAAQGPTIKELAAEYDCARSTIWKVLHGRLHPSGDTLQETIAERLTANMRGLGK
jgi:transcriptional regulator with XRE-family HTH domain